MRTIAMDTSLSTGAVAATDGSRWAVRTLPSTHEHARLLAGAAEAAAAELGWTIADAELVAVIRGPGSFTGLRVGVAAAKAIAWASGCRLLGVSSCEAIALGTATAVGRCDVPIWVAFDAGRGDIHASRVLPATSSPSGWVVETVGLVPRSAFLDRLPAGAIVSGPGLAVLPEAATLRPDIVIAPTSACPPAICDVAAVARLHAAAGAADDPATLVPEYIRPSYADEPAAPLSPRPGGDTMGAGFQA